MVAALQPAPALGARMSARVAGPYGPIAPVNDLTTGLPLLKLPAGFSCKSYGWTGDLMSDGQPTPGNHDGMGVIRSRRVGSGTELVLVRNHERNLLSRPIVAPVPGYDRAAAPGANSVPGGGTTTLVMRDDNWVSAHGSLAGTLVNCAGGVTPWATWLSCEETLVNRESTAASDGAAGRKHGYVFEVPADPRQTSAVPIIGMGRFRHEAAAVDPATGFVYQTEDSQRASGLYRYEPKTTPGAPGSLARGGVLKMAKLKGIRSPDVMLVPEVGDRYEIEWVTIDNPDADPVTVAANALPFIGQPTVVAGCFKEGFDKGGARMSRGEGIHYWNRKMFIVDTAAGRSTAGVPGDGEGAVWQLDLDRQVITCLCAVPTGDPGIGNNFDNIAVSPKGGLLVCEDGGTHSADGRIVGSRLMGVQPDGHTWVFAENNVTPDVLLQAHARGKVVAGMPTPTSRIGAEFAGACFDPAGRVMFVNLLNPGTTVAIFGPWGKGPL
jgi:secreted PhoX family phosphatase